MAISSNASRLISALVIVEFTMNKNITSKRQHKIYMRILGKQPQNVLVIFRVLPFKIGGVIFFTRECAENYLLIQTECMNIIFLIY